MVAPTQELAAGGTPMALQAGADGLVPVSNATGQWGSALQSNLAEEQLLRLYKDSENSIPGSAAGTRTPLPLLDLCVRQLCQNLPAYQEIPLGLPREVVDKLLGSLVQHHALSCSTLQAFRSCEVTSVALSGCRDVGDQWLQPLQDSCGKWLVHLDLSDCSDLTDSGLARLHSLRALETASLRNCHQLGDRATACFTSSLGLLSLSLGHCRHVGDDGLMNIRHLAELRTLDLEGCQGVTDAGLGLVATLHSLTDLNVAQCPKITAKGLWHLAWLGKLRVLNVGWCEGLVLDGARPLRSSARAAAAPAFGEGLSALESVLERNPAEPLEWSVFPTMHSLERLCLANCGITDRSLGQLVQDAPGLTELSLSGCAKLNNLGLSALQELGALTSLDVSRCKNASCPPWGVSGLRTLNLAHTWVRDHDLQELVEQAPGLTSLNLDSCKVDNAGLRALAGLTNLEELNLADTEVSDTGLACLTPLQKLRSLNLFFVNMTDAGMEHVARLKALTSINLDNRDLTDRGLTYLMLLPHLRQLDAFSASVSDFGMVHTISRLTGLTSLEISSGRISDNGLSGLRKLPGLTYLNLSQNTHITNEGMRYVGHLSKLRSLNLSACKINAQGLGHLSGLLQLTSLAVYGTSVTQSDLARLRQQLPNLRTIRC